MIIHSRPWLADLETKTVTNVLYSNMLIGGETRNQFRDSLHQYIDGAKRVTLFASGRLAIKSALEALNLPLSSGIVVQSYVCSAVLWAIRAAGHQPVLCDIADGWVAKSEQIEAVFTPDCKAIILAPPFGFRQDACEFRQFDVPIIHDLCQSSPKMIAAGPSDAIGDIACLSFHPTKYLCAGGGGAAIDMTGRYCEQLRLQEETCDEFAPFSDIQAALGVAQLERIDQLDASRSKLFDLYISKAPKTSTQRLLGQIDVKTGAMFRFPLEIVDGEVRNLIDIFSKAGIAARHGVDLLLHHILELDDDDFPNTMRAFQRTISLPFYPSLCDDDAWLVASQMKILK